MVDVFISYSRANRDAVRRIAEAIGALGYVVWWDEELPAHLTYGDVITQKIGEAKATLVVWSVDSTASEWVRAEADLARNQKKLIQAAIDDCTPPLPFNQIQYAAIGDWSGDADHQGWRKVKASLAALCGAPGVVAAPEPVAQAPVAKPGPARGPMRLALAAAAASVMTILTVGSLVFFRGPPAAEARVAEPAPAPAVATPPKTDVADAPEQAAEEGGEAQSDADTPPAVEDEY